MNENTASPVSSKNQIAIKRHMYFAKPAVRILKIDKLSTIVVTFFESTSVKVYFDRWSIGEQQRNRKGSLTLIRCSHGCFCDNYSPIYYFRDLQEPIELGQCAFMSLSRVGNGQENRQIMYQEPLQSSTPISADDIVFGVATHDRAILSDNLASSPAIASGDLQLLVEEQSPSASNAYNLILDRSKAEFIVFAHHDVYLPLGWDALLRARIAEVTAFDPDWAVLAPFGVGLDNQGYGPVWSSSIGEIVGRVAIGPVPVQSVDELLIIVRRSSGLRFDETLPGFHLYGMDIVQSALSRGKGAYVISLPLVHNDGFKPMLDDTFAIACHHQSRKWRHHLPLYSPTIKISWHMISLLRSQWANMRSKRLRNAMALPVREDPRTYASLCGWGNLTPAPLDCKINHTVTGR